MTKGTIACAAAIENCLQAYWKLCPARKPTEAQGIERAAAALKTAHHDLTHFGPVSRSSWVRSARLIEALKLGGEIEPNAKIYLDSPYTNTFVEAFNNFDHVEAEKKERSHAP